MPSDPEPPILWTYTWPQEDTRHDADDLTAWAGQTSIGRIYPVKTAAYGMVWKWFSWTEGARPPEGQTESRRAAMLEIERLFMGKSS